MNELINAAMAPAHVNVLGVDIRQTVSLQRSVFICRDGVRGVS